MARRPRVGAMAVATVTALVSGACGSGGAEPGAATVAVPPPATGISRPAGGPRGSAVAHCAGDADATIETAFAGTVRGVDRTGDPAWVTFDVAEWFTNDTGTEIGLWAPEWDAEVGDRWLIAASRYSVGTLSSGEVFWCSSEPTTEAARGDWVARLGDPVVAGASVPERPPAPEDLAAIDDAEARWAATAPDDYTLAVSVFDRHEFAEAGGARPCGMGGVRVVVSDGDVVQARDVREHCDVPLAAAPTIAGLFDVARANAGALEGPPSFDGDYGFLTDFYANDRSVEVAIHVDEFLPFAAPLDLGDRRAALGDATARWEAAGIDAYSATVRQLCFCTVSGTFDITVGDGPVDVTSVGEGLEGVTVDGSGLTVDAIFSTLSRRLDDEFVEWAFHPELGYPLSARLDRDGLTADDELDVFVDELTPAG